MRRTLNFIFLAFLIVCCFRLFARQATGGKPPANSSGKAKKVFLPPVYLGHSTISGGPVKKNIFDSLLKQGITSRDSLGNIYRIAGFDFSYAERSLYEDSVANLVVLTDFQSEFCKGDTLSSDITMSTESIASIYERTKAGDTAYFDHIRLFPQPGNKLFPTRDSLPILGRGMKFVIIK